MILQIKCKHNRVKSVSTCSVYITIRKHRLITTYQYDGK